MIHNLCPAGLNTQGEKMKETIVRTTCYFTPADLETIERLQAVLGTGSRTETLRIAVEMTLALKTDPIRSLAAAGVHFDSAIGFEFADGKIIVRAPTK